MLYVFLFNIWRKLFNMRFFIYISMFFIYILISISSFADIGVVYKKGNSIHESIVKKILDFATKDKQNYIKVPFNVDATPQSISNEIVQNTNINTLFLIGDFAAKSGISTNLPGVFVNVINPVQCGLIDSSGNYITQLAGISMDIPLKNKMPIITSVLKSINSVLIVYNEIASDYLFRNYEKTLLDFNIKCLGVQADTENELGQILGKYIGTFDCIISFVDNVVYSFSSVNIALKFSILNKVSFISFSPQMVNSGSLMAFYTNYEKLCTQAYNILKEVIQGQYAGNQIEFCSEFSYSINKYIAKILKLKIDDKILNGAENVYEK
ncbi:MAG: ABC transporter substrate-binding lipoprotein [uncultured bacterium]|nr:MAG: ABC transporter substrate-binding lipoprotein [uncultured bacterium]